MEVISNHTNSAKGGKFLSISTNSKTIELVRLANRLSPGEFLMLELIGTGPQKHSALSHIPHIAHEFDPDPPLYRLVEDKLIEKAKIGPKDFQYEINENGRSVLQIIDEHPDMKAMLKSNAFASVHEFVPREEMGGLTCSLTRRSRRLQGT